MLLGSCWLLAWAERPTPLQSHWGGMTSHCIQVITLLVMFLEGQGIYSSHLNQCIVLLGRYH